MLTKGFINYIKENETDKKREIQKKEALNSLHFLNKIENKIIGFKVILFSEGKNDTGYYRIDMEKPITITYLFGGTKLFISVLKLFFKMTIKKTNMKNATIIMCGIGVKLEYAKKMIKWVKNTVKKVKETIRGETK